VPAKYLLLTWDKSNLGDLLLPYFSNQTLQSAKNEWHISLCQFLALPEVDIKCTEIIPKLSIILFFISVCLLY
jgi:hypothetical protein